MKKMVLLLVVAGAVASGWLLGSRTPPKQSPAVPVPSASIGAQEAKRQKEEVIRQRQKSLKDLANGFSKFIGGDQQ